MSGPVSPLSFERYELKYLIPLSMVEPISKFVEARCDMDYYSQISPDNYYTINSLYLDTPNFYLLRFKEMAGAYNFNMRIRSYGHQPKPPYFFEIKYKIHEFVRKNRTQIHTDDWAEILNGAELPLNLDADSAKHLDDFLYMRWTYNVEPIILTQYRRKAYISFIDDYARVTFDRDLRFQEMRECSVKPDEQLLCHYDHPGSFESPGENVILELKCEKKIPVWFIDLIQHFRLEGGSFSKFGNSVATMFEQPELMRPGSLYL
jgi:SPX domain-containing protein involved in vacuolar polyphosphate accumulation